MIDLDQIIRDISPGPAEERSLAEIAESLVTKIRSELESVNIDAEPVLVGSVSKRTYLDPDIDVFISFDRRYDREAMVAAALAIGHKVLPDAIERYAEHPYVSGHINNVKIDVVPCYRIREGEKIISAVDRSPLHTKYVLENISEEQRGQVRLLKAFMKTAGIYGSEVTTHGFSGYVCEVLIIRYGSFFQTIESFASSKGRFVVSGFPVDLRKFNDPAVIIDPVDKSRNAAAAISLENLSRMRVISREFLRSPQKEYFTRDRKSVAVSMDRGTAFRIFRLPSPDLIMDTLYPQTERFRNILVDMLKEGGFEPVASELHVEKQIDIMVECRTPLSPKFFIHNGPPADSARTHDFLSKWKARTDVLGPYIIGDRLYADVPSEQRTIEDYVRSRLPEFNIGAHLNDLKGQLEIIDPHKSSEKFTVVDKFFSRSIF